MPVEKKATYKMEHGKIAEEEIARLEKRRKLKAYGLSEGKRIFDCWLTAGKVGLTGKVDMLIIRDGDYFPVDFKFTEKLAAKNHLYQLCGYCIILDEVYGCQADTAFIYQIPDHDVRVFHFDHKLKSACVAVITGMREMIRQERMPDPTPSRGRCNECEYQNYCRDVW
jgi:CRISPR-associated exonuclease Cas4